MRNYTDFSKLQTLDERYSYLQLGGTVGEQTFGFDRWMNQLFYRSKEWRDIRDFVVVRDNGFDLGMDDLPIKGPHLIHHMNPITVNDIKESTENLLDPEFLITCCLRTHNAVHYGDRNLLPQEFVPRRPGDTKLW